MITVTTARKPPAMAADMAHMRREDSVAAIPPIVRTLNEKELREISEETSSRLPAGDEAIERAFDHRTGKYQ